MSKKVFVKYWYLWFKHESKATVSQLIKFGDRVGVDVFALINNEKLPLHLLIENNPCKATPYIYKDELCDCLVR